jgi:hypothetical protein
MSHVIWCETTGFLETHDYVPEDREGTYCDGTQIIHKFHATAEEERAWPFNPLCNGDGAVNDYRRFTRFWLRDPFDRTSECPDPEDLRTIMGPPQQNQGETDDRRAWIARKAQADGMRLEIKGEPGEELYRLAPRVIPISSRQDIESTGVSPRRTAVWVASSATSSVQSLGKGRRRARWCTAMCFGL